MAVARPRELDGVSARQPSPPPPAAEADADADGAGRLAQAASHVMEGGWLAVAATVPLYFNVLDLRAFEPDKATLLRNLCAVMAAAWVAKVAAGVRSPAIPGTRTAPLRPAIAFFAAATAIATAASVAPVESVVGSYERAQGAVTVACYVFVALAVAANLRSLAQAERLATVMVLASVPVSLYGLAQAADVDPLTWTAAPGRVGSTQGNPVLLAAVLCMVAPLTLTRLTRSVARSRGDGRWVAHAARERKAIGTALAVVAAQIAALAGFLVVGAAVPGSWWGAQAMLALFLCLALVLTSLPGGRGMSGAAAAGYALALVLQLAALFAAASRGPWVGLLVAFGVLGLAASVRSRRVAVRYGAVAAVALAATGFLTLNLVGAPAEAGQASRYLRPFTAVTGGGPSGEVRLVVWESSLGLVVHHPRATLGDDPLGPIRPLVGYGPETFRDVYNQVYEPRLARLEPGSVPDRAHNALLDAAVTGGLLGTAAYLLVFHLFFALALEQSGLVRPEWVRRVRVLVVLFGLLGVVGYLVALAHRGAPPSARRAGSRSALALGFLGMAAAHFVETQFGFGAVATLAYAWLAFGAVAALPAADAAPDASPRPRLRWPAAYAVASAGAAAALAYAGDVGGASRTALLVLGFGWLAGACGVWALANRAAAARPSVRSGGRRMALAASVVGTAVAGVAVVVVGSASVAADVHARGAVARRAAGDRAATIADYQKAIRLAPYEDVYHRALARELVELAGRPRPVSSATPVPTDVAAVVSAPASRLVRLPDDALFRGAELLLARARALEPTNPQICTSLARLHRAWARSAGSARGAHRDAAGAWYRRALRLAPRLASLHLELGAFHFGGHEYSAAITELTRAIALEPRRGVTVARELRGDARLARGDVRAALADYSRALQENPDALFDSRLASRVRDIAQAGHTRDLVAAFRAAIRAAEPRRAWLARKTLGFVYAEIGDLASARREFLAARTFAPAIARRKLDALARRLASGG